MIKTDNIQGVNCQPKWQSLYLYSVNYHKWWPGRDELLWIPFEQNPRDFGEVCEFGIKRNMAYGSRSSS